MVAESKMILAHRLIPAEPARNYFASVINGIDYADEFTKTVFVQLQPNEGLKQLRTNFRVTVPLRISADSALEFDLQTMLRTTKREIANSLSFPFRAVLFDSVKAVISPARIKSREDVEAWRVVATQRLTE